MESLGKMMIKKICFIRESVYSNLLKIVIDDSS